MVYTDRSLNDLLRHPSAKRLPAEEEVRVIRHRDVLEQQVWKLLAERTYSGIEFLFDSYADVGEDIKAEWEAIKLPGNRVNHKKLVAADVARNLQRILYRFAEKQADVYCSNLGCKHKACKRAIAQDSFRELRNTMKQLREVRAKFATSNLRLVMSFVLRYASKLKHMAVEDLFQEGLIGLAKGVERYDISRGFKFSTYAVWWIRHAVTRSIQEVDSTIRIPVHQSERNNRINKLRHKLKAQGTEYTEADLYGAENPRKGVEAGMRAWQQSHMTFHSLDTPVNNGDDPGKLMDFLAAESGDIELDVERIADMQKVLRGPLSKLKEMERNIIMARFGMSDEKFEQMTLQELGDHYGVSRERIRQVQEVALNKLYLYLSRDGIEKLSAVA